MEQKNLTRIITTAVFGGIGIWVVYKIVQSFRKNRGRRHIIKKKVYVINCAEDWEAFYSSCIEHRDIKVLGLDCEWVGKRRVALLQLATQHGDCALVRLSKMTSVIPETLQILLKDKRILKVGVAVKDDGKKLLHDYGIIVSGCVDLRNIFNRVNGVFECDSLGLQGLAKGVLGYSLSKNPAIRLGNWEANVYSDEQIDYAANDAVVGVDIFLELVRAKVHRRRQFATQTRPKLPSEVRFWITAQSLCQGLVDTTYRYRSSGSMRPSRVYQDMLKQITENEKQGIPISGDDDETEEGENSTDEQSTGKHKTKGCKAYVVRQRPLYHNCFLLAPDDELLCTCDVRKAAWYIEKGLAVKISDNPVTVKLKFEPSGRPKEDYYLQEKENICVVCGATESFIRKCVIPKEYRKYFPHQLKEHASHDVLLMCVTCHMRSTDHDTILRQKLADECNAPIDSGSGIKHTEDTDLRRIQSYAKVYNKYYKPHGKRVVSYMKRNAGLYQFERMWRKHFIDTMSPQHMPLKWSVDHRNEHYNIKNIEED